MRLLCNCYVIAMGLPCDCHVIAMVGKSVGGGLTPTILPQCLAPALPRYCISPLSYCLTATCLNRLNSLNCQHPTAPHYAAPHHKSHLTHTYAQTQTRAPALAPAPVPAPALPPPPPRHYNRLPPRKATRSPSWSTMSTTSQSRGPAGIEPLARQSCCSSLRSVSYSATNSAFVRSGKPESSA